VAASARPSSRLAFEAGVLQAEPISPLPPLERRLLVAPCKTEVAEQERQSGIVGHLAHEALEENSFFESPRPDII